MRLEELERCLNELSNYSLIQASIAIRALLLDSQPLVEMLNREKHVPIVYRVNNQKWHDDAEPGTINILRWKEINPDLSGNYVELKKDAFLKMVCIYYFESSITIHDIIKFYAYVRGGIHLDDGNSEYESLRSAFDVMKINNVSNLDHSMRGIIQVIYRALNKYKEALLFN